MSIPRSLRKRRSSKKLEMREEDLLRLHRHAIRPQLIFIFLLLLLAIVWGPHTAVWALSAAAAVQIVGQVIDPSSGLMWQEAGSNRSQHEHQLHANNSHR